jgi:hypothetical protein
MPYITYDCGGRLGNCIFPFFFCIFFEMKYGYTYSVEDHYPQITITDDVFREIITEENVLSNTISLPPTNLRLWGYFQHDWIFKHFRKEMMAYLEKSPKWLIIMAKSLNQLFSSETLLTNSLPTVNLGPKDVVIHLRLEDYLVNDKIEPNGPHFVFSPDDYDPILKSLDYENIYWVMKKPEHPIEHKYLAYLLKKWGGLYTPQTLEQDICLMRKAHILICSRSTLSWTSSYLSPHDEQTVFLPLKKVDWKHEQCPGIYPNTTLFDYKKCTIQDLERIIDKQ